MTISTKQAEQIAAQWHSPSARDRNITALSHGLHHRINMHELVDEIRRQPGWPGDKDLQKLMEWVRGQ